MARWIGDPHNMIVQPESLLRAVEILAPVAQEIAAYIAGGPAPEIMRVLPSPLRSEVELARREAAGK